MSPKGSDRDKDLDAFRRGHVGRAVARAHWTFEAQFQERIEDLGVNDFRLSDVQVIARLPTSGTRITDIAARAGITKQAAGKLVTSLEERGYVKRLADPNDGRAQRVVLSERGWKLLRAARTAIDAIEADWVQVIGASEMKRLKQTLLKLSDTFGEAEFL